MSEAKPAAATETPKKKRWWRWPLRIVVALLVLLLVAFLYVNNGGFVRRHVFPVIAEQLGEPVTAETVKFSVFGGLELGTFRVGPEADPLVGIDRLQVAYQFGPLLGKKVVVDTVTVQGLSVHVTGERLARLQAKFAAGPPPEPAPPKAPGAPFVEGLPEIVVHRVLVEDVTLAADLALPGDQGPLSVQCGPISLAMNEITAGGSDVDATVEDLLVEQLVVHKGGDQQVDLTLGPVRLGDFQALLQGNQLRVALKPHEETGSGLLVQAVRAEVRLPAQDLAATVESELALSGLQATLDSAGNVTVPGGSTAELRSLLATVQQPGLTAKAQFGGTLALPELSVAPGQLPAQSGPLTLTGTTATLSAEVQEQTLRLALDQPTLTIDGASGDTLAPTVHLGLAGLVFQRGADRVQASAGALQLDAKLLPDFVPESAALDGRIDLRATLGGVDFAERRIAVRGHLKKNLGIFEIGDLELTVQQGEVREARLGVSGLVDPVSPAANLDLTFAVPTSAPLNLVGGLVGDYHFGQTTIDFTSKLEMPTPRQAKLQSKLTVKDFTVASEALKLPKLPPLAIDFQHQLAFDLDRGELQVTELGGGISDPRRELATLRLTAPLALNLKAPTEVSDTELVATVDRLDLGLVRALVPPTEAFAFGGGELSAEYRLVVKEQGMDLRVVGSTQASRLDLTVAGRKLDLLNVALTLQGGARELAQGNADLTVTATTPQGTIAKVEADVKLALEATPAEARDDPAAKAAPPRFSGTTSVKVTEVGPPLFAWAAPLLNGMSLNQTKAGLTLDGELREGGTQLQLSNRFTVEDLSVTLPGEPSLRTPTFWIVSTKEQTINLSELTTRLGSVLVEVADTKGVVARLTLAEPVTLALTEPDFGGELMQLQLEVPGYDLSTWQAPLAPALGLERLSGTVTGGWGIAVQGPGQAVAIKGEVLADAVTVDMKDVLALAKPVSVKAITQLNLRQETRADGAPSMPVNVDQVRLIAAAGEQLADVTLSGELDLADPTRRTRLSLTSTTPILADQAQALLVLPEKPVAEEPPPETEKPPVELPDVWFLLEHDLAEVRYRQLQATNIKGQAEYRNRRLELPGTSLDLNGGTFALKGYVDLKELKKPKFEGDFEIRELGLDPLVKSFAPGLPVQLQGGLKDLQVNVAGDGLSLGDLRQNLKADFAGDLGAFEIQKPAGAANPLTDMFMDQVVGRALPIGWEDLQFDGGQFAANLDPEGIDLKQLAMKSGLLKLDTKGRLDRQGDGWTPNLEVGTAFAGETLEKAKGMGVKLGELKDGYAAGPAIPISGDLTSKENLMRLGTELLKRAKIGDMDLKDIAIEKGKEIFKDKMRKKEGEEAKDDGDKGAAEKVLDLFKK